VFKTDEIIGDVVLIDMREERYTSFGISGTSHHFLVKDMIILEFGLSIQALYQ